MLTNPTLEKLIDLGLKTMAEGLSDQLANPGGFAELPFCDRLGLIVDKEVDARDSRRLKMRLAGCRGIDRGLHSHASG